MSRKLTARSVIEIKERHQSCRFCCVGVGLHKVEDTERKEVFYLCDKHKAEYNIENDSIPTTIIESESEVE